MSDQGKKIPPKPGLPPRPPAPPTPARPVPPAAPTGVLAGSMKRAEEREIRREGARTLAQQSSDQRRSAVRPVVRPAAPPQKVMPKVPAPARPVAARPAPLPKRAPAPAPAAVAPAVAAAAVATLNAANAHQALVAEAQSLQSSLSDLQNRSNFSGIIDDINRLDGEVKNLTELAESARQKGFAFQNDLETTLFAQAGQWQGTRPQLLSSVQQQALTLQPQLTNLAGQVGQLNAMLNNPTRATPQLRSTQAMVNSLLQAVNNTEGSLKKQYSELESQLNTLNTRLTQIHWALDQMAEAKWQPASGEALVMAISARWDKEGKEDPEGVLYLSNRRLVFERKEKVATKKILFITTASELVHEVLIDQPLANLRKVTADNRGLFGHQDYLMADFSDPKLGQIAFHINGQSSSSWAEMIEKARSGAIETERYTPSGISAADLTRPLTQADLVALQGEVNGLQDEMMLQSSRQELSELENDLRALERKLADLRTRGYDIEKDLEGEITILAAQWERIKANAEKTLEYQARQLGDQTRLMQQSLAQLVGMAGNLSAARPLYMQLKSSVASAAAQAEAARATVEAQYDAYADEVEGLSAHLEWVEWMLAALDSASFRLLATECGIAAVEAVLFTSGGEQENGILFLTDQRLLWEDRVGTYELKIDLPLQAVQETSKVTNQATGQESLNVRLSQGAYSELRFALAQPVADDWMQMIGRARSGGYAHDRAESVSAEELARIRNAPTQCANCGAAYTLPLLRGQTEIRCEYCSHIARI